jgi:rod shape determining protein RodA
MLSKDKREVNWPLIAATVALLSLGLLQLYSVLGKDAWRQLMYAGIGIPLMIGLCFVHYGRLQKVAPWLYGFALVALAVVMVPGVGQTVNGAQRWVSLGPLGSFQPSEVAKLALIVMLARYLSAREKVDGKRLIKGLGIMAAPFLLTLIQPDLGTACVLLAITFGMLFLAGASPLYLGGLIVTGLGVLPFILHDYQRNRLLVFMDPDLDSQGMGYNLVQSKTSIGSGGLYGSGLTSGPMTQHGFVPENMTDFIITGVGEELGFLGCIGVVLLFVILLAILVRTCDRAYTRFGALLVAGVGTMIAFQAVINMGMTMGLVPAVGIPLPLVSNGGTSLLITLAGLGIAGSVSRMSRGREQMPTWSMEYRPWDWAA